MAFRSYCAGDSPSNCVASCTTTAAAGDSPLTCRSHCAGDSPSNGGSSCTTTAAASPLISVDSCSDVAPGLDCLRSSPEIAPSLCMACRSHCAGDTPSNGVASCTTTAAASPLISVNFCSAVAPGLDLYVELAIRRLRKL